MTRDEANLKMCTCGAGHGAVPYEERQESLRVIDEDTATSADGKLVLRMDLFWAWQQREITAVIERCVCP